MAEMVDQAERFFVTTRRYDLLNVEGADAESFLQGQLSQDLTQCAKQETVSSLLLSPQGKLVAWIKVFRADTSVFHILVEQGFGSQVLERLQRFKLRVDVSLSQETRTAFVFAGTDTEKIVSETENFMADGSIVFRQQVSERFFVSEVFSDTAIADFKIVDEQIFTDQRILHRVPQMGTELLSSTIPASAGIVDTSVSFTKGCYVGQELVARIDSRGAKTPTRLVSVISSSATDGFPVPESDLSIIVDDIPVGSVTSATKSSRIPQALGYVKRSTDLPAEGQVVGSDGRKVSVLIQEAIDKSS